MEIGTWDEETNSFVPLGQSSEDSEQPFSALASTFHRPNHDPFVERTVFGLQYATGPAWDYFDLSPKTTPDAPFDLVFGRMLLPMSDLGADSLRSRVESILAPRGAYFLHVDGRAPVVGP